MNKEQYEVFVSANEYIQRFIPGINQLCIEFRDEDISNIENLVGGLEGFAWLVEVISLTSDSHDMKVDIDRIEEQLQEITKVLNEGTFSAISDIIENEIVPLVTEWDNGIKTLLANYTEFLN